MKRTKLQTINISSATFYYSTANMTPSLKSNCMKAVWKKPKIRKCFAHAHLAFPNVVLYPILLSQSWSTTVPIFMFVSGIAQSGQNLALSRLAIKVYFEFIEFGL